MPTKSVLRAGPRVALGPELVYELALMAHGRTHRCASSGRAGQIDALRAQIGRLASFDAPGNPHVPTVLLLGETGTGKGLVARVIHDSGPRAAGPFVDVNCAAIPETMLEAELFGFEAGAFTDAKRTKPGLFEAASGGTLFLDEIDSLSPPVQSKVLKAIEEKRVRRLGAVAPRDVDVKLIAATQTRSAGAGRRRRLPRRSLPSARRLDPVHPAAARARAATPLLLAEHFLRTYAEAHGLAPKRLTDSGRAWLAAYTWPGNVRELGHLMERVTLLSADDEVERATRSTGARSGIGCAGAQSPRRTGGGQPTRDEPADDARDERRSGAHPRGAGARRRQRRARRAAARHRAQRAALPDAPPRHRKPTAGPICHRCGARAALAGAGRSAQPPPPPAARAERGGAGSRSRSRCWSISLTFPDAGDRRSATSPGPRRAAGSAPSPSASKASAACSCSAHRRGSPPSSAFRARSSRRRSAPCRRRWPFCAPWRTAERAAPGVARRGARRRRAARRRRRRSDGAPVPDRRHLLAAGAPARARRRRRGAAVARRRAPRRAQLRARSRAALQLGPQRGRSADRARGRAAAAAHGVGRWRATTSLAVRRPRPRARSARRRLRARRRRPRPGRVHRRAKPASASRACWREFRRRLAGHAAPVDRGALRVVRQHDALPAAHRRPAPLHRHRRPRRRGQRQRQDRATPSAELGIDLGWTLPFVKQLLSLDVGDDTRPRARLRQPPQRAVPRPARADAARRGARAAGRSSSRICTGSIRRRRSGWPSSPTSSRPRARCSSSRIAPATAIRSPDRSFHVRVALPPLSGGDMAAMTGSLLGTPEIPAALRALIADKAEGNPFFVEELARSLLEDGALRRDDGRIVAGARSRRPRRARHRPGRPDRAHRSAGRGIARAPSRSPR